MHKREMIESLFQNRIAALAAGVALALAAISLLAVTARADENHGDAAHSVSLSCPGTVAEGDSVVVTLTRGDDATKPIKGEMRAKDFFAEWHDFENLVRDIDHDGDTVEVEIYTTDDSWIEGDESFRVIWKNDHDHDDEDSICLVLIIDDDDVDVESLTVTSTPESGDTYGLDEVIEFTMVLDKEVDAGRWTSYVQFEVGKANDSDGYTNRIYRRAGYASGSGSDTIVFHYEVKRYDLDLNGLSITDRCGLCGLPGMTYAGTDTEVSIVSGYTRKDDRSGHKIDGRPRITGFEITSTPEDGEAYRFREQIVVEMTLDAKAKLYGTPGLKLTVGDSTEWAVFDADLTEEANGSAEEVTTLIFVYDVGTTDVASDGVEVPANDTNDSTQFVIPGRAADLDEDGEEIEVRFEVFHEFSTSFWVKTQARYDHDGLEADSDHAVDGTDPLIEVSIGSIDGSLGATLTFWNMPNDEGDLTWRADLESGGVDQDDCESTNMGADNTIDEDDIPELGESIERTVSVDGSCNAGAYSVEVTATIDGDEVAEASESFQISLSWLPVD